VPLRPRRRVWNVALRTVLLHRRGIWIRIDRHRLPPIAQPWIHRNRRRRIGSGARVSRVRFKSDFGSKGLETDPCEAPLRPPTALPACMVGYFAREVKCQQGVGRRPPGPLAIRLPVSGCPDLDRMLPETLRRERRPLLIIVCSGPVAGAERSNAPRGDVPGHRCAMRQPRSRRRRPHAAAGLGPVGR
jgi:hypothetical protein